MRPVGIVLVLAGAVALAGCASATKVAAPKGPDHALLSSVLGGMKTNLVSVRIGEPTKEWGGPSGHLQFLYVKPANTKPPRSSITEDWYTTLIAGAYQAQCGRRSANCLVGFQTDGIEGSRLQATRAPLPHVSSRALGREIRARFAKQGLRVTSISFERPYGLAPVVTVTSSRPQRATTAFYRSSPFLDLPIEGFLVRMVDGSGRTFLIDASSLRTKEGSGWTRPGLKVPREMELATP
jgi:hypothetical protein